MRVVIIRQDEVIEERETDGQFISMLNAVAPQSALLSQPILFSSTQLHIQGQTPLLELRSFSLHERDISLT